MLLSCAPVVNMPLGLSGSNVQRHIYCIQFISHLKLMFRQSCCMFVGYDVVALTVTNSIFVFAIGESVILFIEDQNIEKWPSHFSRAEVYYRSRAATIDCFDHRLPFLISPVYLSKSMVIDFACFVEKSLD